MIKPTVGRIIWVRNRPGSINSVQPEAGQVVFVHGNQSVNVVGHDGNGTPFVLMSLYLAQEGIPLPFEGMLHAEWMPYQVGQAAKTEELEKRIGSGG